MLNIVKIFRTTSLAFVFQKIMVANEIDRKMVDCNLHFVLKTFLKCYTVNFCQ